MEILFYLYVLVLLAIAVAAITSFFVTKDKHSKEFALFFLTLWLVVSFLSITNAYPMLVKYKAEKAAASIQQLDQQITAVREYEVNKKIEGERAWWINMPLELLVEKYHIIANKIGRDWQSLVDLLSGKNATVVFSPRS